MQKMITFAAVLQKHKKMKGNDRSLGSWVTGRVLRGKYLFTKEDLTRNFEGISPDYLKNSISRLIRRGMVMSPWRSFYVAVPEEYRLKGHVPPLFYIDGLMSFVGRPYYVALLSAAYFQGASHQVPQSFMVITEGKTLRRVEKNGARIVFVSRNKIPDGLIEQTRTQTGDVNISSPMLTALDLVEYENKIGGISRVSEVLSELMEGVDFSEAEQQFYLASQAPVYQRLGYIIESVLEMKDQADILFDGCQKAGLKFRKTPLKKGKECDGLAAETRWKIQVNVRIEMDEL